MRRLLVLAPATLLAAGCGRLDTIDVVRSGSATVPGAPGASPLPGGMATFPIALGSDALRAQGIRPSAVDSARLAGLTLDVTRGTSLEAWLQSVSLYVEAPGLPRVLVARKTGIGALPPGTTRVDLDTFGVDLKPYVLAPTTTVTAEGAGTVPPVDTTIQATATVAVKVDVAGLL